MTDFPAGISTFRERENLPNQEYDPAKKTTLYNEDITRIENELKAVEAEVLAGGAGVDAPTREIINNNELLSRSIYRVKYGTFTQLGGDGDGTTDLSIADDTTLHIAMMELAHDTVFSKMTVKSNNHVTNGDIQFGIYDAYTGKVILRETFVITGGPLLITNTISEKVLRAGQYILVCRGYNSYDGSMFIRSIGQSVDALQEDAGAQTLITGIISGYAGTELPDSVDLADLEYTGQNEALMVRLGA